MLFQVGTCAREMSLAVLGKPSASCVQCCHCVENWRFRGRRKGCVAWACRGFAFPYLFYDSRCAFWQTQVTSHTRVSVCSLFCEASRLTRNVPLASTILNSSAFAEAQPSPVRMKQAFGLMLPTRAPCHIRFILQEHSKSGPYNFKVACLPSTTGRNS